MLISKKQTEEQHLLKKMAQGDAGAYETIFNTYWKRLYLYAFKVYNDEPLCEDMVQEVFINLWERRKELKIIQLESYLFRAVKYKMANAVRNLKFTEDHLSALNKITTDDTNISNIEYKELQKEINNLINSLPKKCKNVFIMSRYDQLTNAEIAAELNLSIRTVETHISNALKYLKSNMNTVPFYIIITLMLTVVR